MSDTSDIYPGIARTFPHCVAGMHLGRMDPTPMVGEFDVVLSVGAIEGKVEDQLRHKHQHLPYGPEMDLNCLQDAAKWVQSHVDQNRRILVRSEGGKQRPGLVIATVVLRLGGTCGDAISCVRSGRRDALTDFRYLRDLREMDREMNPRRFDGLWT